MIFFVAQMLALFLAALLAFLRGGGPEKIVAVILCAWFIGNGVVRLIFGASDYQSFEALVFASELVALGVFLAVALRANRYWTLWLASTQLIAVVGHILGWLGLAQHPLVYAIFTQLPFWLAILLLLIGALGAQSPERDQAEWKLSN